MKKIIQRLKEDFMRFMIIRKIKSRLRKSGISKKEIKTITDKINNSFKEFEKFV